MKTKRLFMILVMAVCLTFCSANLSQAAPLGTAFTYQGHLYDNNDVADGEYDFQFKLYDSNSDGGQISYDVNKAEVDVIDGYFTVELDFGSSVFDGNSVWLEIGVRHGDFNDPNVYTILTPRQAVTPMPYALYAATGTQGPIGLTGDIGPQGDKGDTGDIGPQGIQGIQGDIGPQGDKGDTGDTGLQGLIGPIGPQGEQGNTGDTGLQGPIGLTGPQGANRVYRESKVTQVIPVYKARPARRVTPVIPAHKDQSD